MPDLSFSEIAIGFDMFGCPNRCRHCFMGWGPGGVGEGDLRRIAAMFRRYRRAGQDRPQFGKVWVSTSIREPDFSDDYRRLYELEAQLSDGAPWRYELLSIWRLARDETYAPWARSVGPDTCQITFFGEEETTDWFCRRRGAFRDNLIATERLLEAGMKPRWQLFANTRGLGELDSLMRRIDALRLPQRVAAIGGEFVVFVHPWGVCGQALDVEHLRPTLAEMSAIPRSLLDATRRHFAREDLWRTEAELCRHVLAGGVKIPYAIQPGHLPWFLITGRLDVYFNAFGTEPWFALGNLATEPLETVLQRFERDDTPGLRVVYHMDPRELVRAHGRLDGQRVYHDADDLLGLYVARHCARRSE